MQGTTLQTETIYIVAEMKPLQVEKNVYCAKEENMSHPVPTKGFL